MTEAERAEATASCERLLVAMQGVIDTFGAERVSTARLIEVLQTPVPLTEVLSGFDFSVERSKLTAVLDEFETARREARLAAWRLMAAGVQHR